MNEGTTNLKVANAVMLVFTTHAWGNRRKADIKKIESGAEKSFLSLSKRLIDSSEYKSILNFQNEVYNWINVNAVPSFFLRGAYLFNMAMVEEVEQYLKTQSAILKEKVKPLLAEYEQKITDAESRLGDQFNSADYPTLAVLEDSFSFSWKWTIFDIPEGLPEKIFQEEKMKAENMWRESAEQISLCLRQAFVGLIQHANSMLQPGENGKTKAFKNSSFDNIDQFICTFKNRNIVNDKDLEVLVNQAKAILVDINDPQELKKDNELRKVVSKNFDEITSKLSEMVVNKPGRKFNLD